MLAGCVTTTDDGFSVSFGDGDDSTPAEAPADTPTPSQTPTDTPTASPTPTAHPTPSFSQDCLGLDPEAVEIQEDGSGGFQLVEDESILLAFDSFDNAKASRDIIKGYGFTQQCFVGRPDPPFAYWLVDEGPPKTGGSSPVETEDCISLDPNNIEVEEDGSGGYRIVDGKSILLAFDELGNANRTRDIIRHYGFTQQCFVGRPNPPFEYWLADS